MAYLMGIIIGPFTILGNTDAGKIRAARA